MLALSSRVPMLVLVWLSTPKREWPQAGLCALLISSRFFTVVASECVYRSTECVLDSHVLDSHVLDSHVYI